MTKELARFAPVEVNKNFNATFFDDFAEFADIPTNSVKTYLKSLRQMFRYFRANAITKPTRQNLKNWFLAMNASAINPKDEKSTKILLDEDSVLHFDGEIAQNGKKYRVVDEVLYLGSQIVGRKKSASTIQLYCTVAKIFFRWLAQKNLYPNIADNLKSGVKVTQNHKKDALTCGQCADLIKNVKGNSEKDLRDRAILSLMTTAGLRTVEIVRANVGDIRQERGKNFLYIQGKGRSEADEKILLGKKTYAAIQAYLSTARKNTSPQMPLFVSTSRSNRGARLDTQSIRKMVKRNLREIGLNSPRLTAHSLRHSVATNLIYSGAELPKVQMVMRHKSLSTTLIYTHAYERYQNDCEQVLDSAIYEGVSFL